MGQRKRDTAGLYRTLREMKGRSQRALAAELGVPRRVVTAIETGETQVPAVEPPADSRLPDRLTRSKLDGVLALGTPDESGGWVYAIGEVHPATSGGIGHITIQHPEVGYDRPESADAVEALLRSLGYATKVAVPIMESLLRQRADVIAEEGGYLDLSDIVAHLDRIDKGPHWPVDDEWPARQLLGWDLMAD